MRSTTRASIVRPAVRTDAESIMAIWRRGWPDGHAGHVPAELHAHRTPAFFAARVRELLDSTWVSADSGGVPVGFVVVQRDEVEQVYVDVPARGTGVASALLAHAEGVVAERFEVAWLAVVAGNTRARRFYERQGWTDTGPIAYEAATATASLPVLARRYEKRVR